MRSNRFFSALAWALFMFISSYSHAQSDALIKYLSIPTDHQARVITDRKNHITYVLDSSHGSVEAVTQNGHRIWKTEPWKDYKWKVPETERQIIIEFAIRNDSLTHFRDE